MAIYDYIIVGGGISGLYMAYQLSKTDKSILIVESTNRWGGRLFTQSEKGSQFELGAARISSKHKKMMSLLKEFNLHDKLITLPSKISYKIMGPNVEFYSLIEDLLNGAKLYTKNYLQSVTLLQVCFDVLGKRMTYVLKSKLGYDSEFETMNAHQALKSFKQDLFGKTDYYVISSGFSSLIQKMIDHLDSCDNVTMKLDTDVTDIGKNFIQMNRSKLFGHTILCCVPKKALQSFPKFKDVEAVNDVAEIPLLRIYARYPKDKSGKVWFHNLKRTITDNYIRHIIPIDVDSGLIMISYTDGMYATMWSNLSKMGQSQLIRHLHKEVKAVLGITPPKPDFVYSHYWSAGVHMWKPGLSVKERYETILKPFPENIYVVNEAYSKHQCWVEGSLSMCYDVLTRIDSNFTHIGGKDKKPKKRIKLYTIKRVLQEPHWIILKVKGQHRIYDVSRWFQDHPGGKDNLKRGIQANHHYEDPEKYPEAPIDLFKQIGRHKSGKVMQTMLLRENDKVKHIGNLKHKESLKKNK